MSLIKRIETGMTTVDDADEVRDIIKTRRIGRVVILLISAGTLLIGLAVGGLFF